MLDRGFAIGELIVVLFFIGVLAYGGYNLWQNISPTVLPTPTPTTRPTETPTIDATPTPALDLTADWNTYIDEFRRYNIKYPDGWDVGPVGSEGDVVTILYDGIDDTQAITYAAISITITQNTTEQTDTPEDTSDVADEQIGTVTIGELTGTRYSETSVGDNVEGERIELTTDQETIIFVFSINKDNPAKERLMNEYLQIVATFRLAN